MQERTREADHMNHRVDQAYGLKNLMRHGEVREREEIITTRPRAKRGSAVDPQSVYARVYIRIHMHVQGYIHIHIHVCV